MKRDAPLLMATRPGTQSGESVSEGADVEFYVSEMQAPPVPCCLATP